MFGVVLEVAIGIILVFLLVSIICSGVREGLESILKTRAAYLERGIRELLQGEGNRASPLATAIYRHPLVSSLYSANYQPTEKGGADVPMLARGGSLPSYIPSRNFALALMDIAARGQTTDEVSGDPAAPPITLESMRLNVRNIGNPAVQRVMLSAIDLANGDIAKAQAAIEEWYDSAMDRVSGWYKRSTQWILFWIGLIVAAALNVNAIAIADYLYRNDSARAAIVARAQTVSADTGYLHQSYLDARAALDSLELPIGWGGGWGLPRTSTRPTATAGAATPAAPAVTRRGFWNDGFGPLIGWFITALAATLGAPFWFDLLNKVMLLRSTVKPKARTDEEPPAPRAAPAIEARAVVVASSNGDTKPVGRPGLVPIGPAPSPRDDSSGVDSCAIAVQTITADEDLPPADGGVA